MPKKIVKNIKKCIKTKTTKYIYPPYPIRKAINFNKFVFLSLLLYIHLATEAFSSHFHKVFKRKEKQEHKVRNDDVSTLPSIYHSIEGE